MLSARSRVRDVTVARLSPSAIGGRRRGRSAIPRLNWSSRHFRCRSHQVGLANRARQGEICLLEVLDVELKGIQPRLVHYIMNPMDNRLSGSVFLAPERRRHGPAFTVDSDNIKLISPGTLHRSNIKSEDMSFLSSAFNVIYLLS
jgi:hypothetical protein